MPTSYLLRLPEAGPTKAAAYSPAAQLPAGGGWPNTDNRPPPADRNQAYGGPAIPPNDRNQGGFASPSFSRTVGPTAAPAAGGGSGERPRLPPTRKGKKRPKTKSQTAAAAAHGGGIGGYEINVYGPNGGRSYTIVDGLPSTVGRRNSAEEQRGGGGGYARPPRQAAKGLPPDVADKNVGNPWKNDKHWVGHTLHSQEADENLPFLF